MYTIYGRDTCPYCVKTVELCEDRAFEYEFISVNDDFVKFGKLQEEHQHNTVPLIMEDGVFIGGYNDLHKSTGHHSVWESAMWWVGTLVAATTNKKEYLKRMNARNSCHAATASRKADK